MTNEFRELINFRRPGWAFVGDVPPIQYDTRSVSPLYPAEVSMLKADFQHQLDFRHQVALQIAGVPEVQAVFTTEYGRENGRVFFVWTVVPDRKYEVYRRIYEKEREIIEAHAPLQFDFTIMPSRGRDPRTLISDPNALLVYVRD